MAAREKEKDSKARSSMYGLEKREKGRMGDSGGGEKRKGGFRYLCPPYPWRQIREGGGKKAPFFLWEHIFPTRRERKGERKKKEKSVSLSLQQKEGEKGGAIR